jgi:putative transposase
LSDYKRVYISGGTYFFTVVTDGRRPMFADDANVTLLRDAFRYVKTRRPFDIIAAVVLPDHLHTMWGLPEGDSDFSTRWQMIKTAFSRKVDASLRRDGSKRIWQPRFWEHLIRDEEDYQKHLDYIHFNPVKHGYTSKPGDWQHSSFKQLVEQGVYDDPAWGVCEPDNIKQMHCE